MRRIPHRKRASAPAVIHRAWDVYEWAKYQAEVRKRPIETEGENGPWLQDYQRMQRMLASPKLVGPYLEELDALVRDSGDLDTALATAERGQWADVRPKFLEALTPDAFYAVVSRGQAFEDWVSQAHGVQTHRIQWYLLGRDYARRGGYAHTPVKLYQMAVDPRWRFLNGMVPGNMWDLVVDSSDKWSPAPTDFTRPENLEAYLIGGHIRNTILPDLVASARATHEAVPLMKAMYRLLRPSGHEQRMREDPKATLDVSTDEKKSRWTGFTGQGRASVRYEPGDDPAATGQVDPVRVEEGFREISGEAAAHLSINRPPLVPSEPAVQELILDLIPRVLRGEF